MKRKTGLLALGALLGAGLMALAQAQPHAAAEAMQFKTAVALVHSPQATNPHYLYRLWSDGSVEVNTYTDFGWQGWKPLQ
jgi:hypothetical protein